MRIVTYAAAAIAFAFIAGIAADALWPSCKKFRHYRGLTIDETFAVWQCEDQQAMRRAK